MSNAEQVVHIYSDTPEDSYLGRQAHHKHRLLKMTRGNMHNAWREDDQLVAKFFPVPVEPKFASAYLKARKERYNERIGRKRWMRIPATPQSLSELYTPLTELFNRILFLCNISKFRRLFINTHGRQKKKTYEIRPGIVLSGIGAEFATSAAPVPRAFHDSMISVIEIVLGSDSDLTEARDRLVVHMHQIFQSQDNRRFAFGIIITQNTFTVYMFDHAGAVASKPFNYHENPEQLFAVISGLAGEGSSIGFDTTIRREHDYATVYTLDSQNGGSKAKTYKLESRLFRFTSLVGKGTMCWVVSPLEGPAERLVVKDAWIAEDELEGRESEGDLLRHAKHMGVTLGLAQIRHAEDVLLGTYPSHLDTIGRNRRAPGERRIDRVHRRIVMKAFGVTLEKFATRHELILAFHDAVLAHRNLHQVAGILHRDISPHNILINPNGVEGDRGILIDLDHAIRVGDTSPYSTKGQIGTWRFMSRNVLEEDDTHTYIDDLESFFYMLLWIVSIYERPHVVTPNIPVTVSMWDGPGASTPKYGLFELDTRLVLQPWFGRCFHDLVFRLLKFVRSRRPLYGLSPPKPNPEKDYGEFLGHIRQCIVELEAEDHLRVQDTSSAQDGYTDPLTPPKAPSAPRRRRKAQRLPPDLKAYPKRSTANYGMALTNNSREF